VLKAAAGSELSGSARHSPDQQQWRE